MNGRSLQSTSPGHSVSSTSRCPQIVGTLAVSMKNDEPSGSSARPAQAVIQIKPACFGRDVDRSECAHGADARAAMVVLEGVTANDIDAAEPAFIDISEVIDQIV